MKRPRIGISSCLLGQEVRYDGTHKRDNWICAELSEMVTFWPLCPEMEMGLGVPRETIRLQKKGSIQLISNENNVNLTKLGKGISKALVENLPRNLNGFILKSSSPSCGLKSTKIYSDKKIKEIGSGVFAKELIKANLFPLIDEKDLMNLSLREDFIAKVWVHFFYSKSGI